tara:strand:+ start:273 stop:455 length:183 start_codon:yes stop_codon:yes gene_type:complete
MWTEPEITEVSVGLEINSYACALMGDDEDADDSDDSADVSEDDSDDDADDDDSDDELGSD